MHTKILPNVFALTLCSMGAYAEEASQHGFIEDSHATLSSRTMYYGNDNHEGGADQREVATALKFDYLSGFISYYRRGLPDIFS